MSALTMNPLPHRKPLPGFAPPAPPAQPYTNNAPTPPAAFADAAPQHDYGHSRSRTTSSSVMPMNGAPAPADRHPSITTQQSQPPYGQPTRRTLSNATSSTSSTSTTANVQRVPTNSSFSAAAPPRRSTSSRSTASASPTSYVALMRKQKATVWCDRAQHEDPRILAAQRAAKLRATMEVAGGGARAPAAGGAGGGRASTSSSGMVGGVRSKIRHHGAPKASTYNFNVSGAGVPMRLSATEVDEGDSDEEAASLSAAGQYAGRYHSRHGSGRSSVGGNGNSHGARGHSSGSTPLGHSPDESPNGLLDEQTPVPHHHPGGAEGGDYFGRPSAADLSAAPPPAPARARARADTARKTSDELRRRGSVDDRTMTMGGGRLFVANPDLSD